VSSFVDSNNYGEFAVAQTNVFLVINSPHDGLSGPIYFDLINIPQTGCTTAGFVEPFPIRGFM
jgi:hypothetical protein